MSLREFILKHDVDYTYNRVNEAFFPLLEELVGMKLGEQLKRYLLDYGYLGFRYVELYGVNAAQGVRSDMIVRTNFLHEHFECTKGLVAIEDRGDGDYALVDENDMVFTYLEGRKGLIETDLSLEEYVLQRFEDTFRNDF